MKTLLKKVSSKIQSYFESYTEYHCEKLLDRKPNLKKLFHTDL